MCIVNFLIETEKKSIAHRDVGSYSYLKPYYFFVKNDLSHMNTELNPLILNIS
jgi:hypothetical protein